MQVMATSGLVCLRFIIQNTYSPRFLPIICQHVSSKSKEIRRHICEFLDQLLHSWPSHSLEKHVVILQEAIKKGVSDADPDARTFARKVGRRHDEGGRRGEELNSSVRVEGVRVEVRVEVGGNITDIN